MRIERSGRMGMTSKARGPLTRRVRVILSDPDATDCSSDEEGILLSKKCIAVAYLPSVEEAIASKKKKKKRALSGLGLASASASKLACLSVPDEREWQRNSKKKKPSGLRFGLKLSCPYLPEDYQVEQTRVYEKEDYLPDFSQDLFDQPYFPLDSLPDFPLDFSLDLLDVPDLMSDFSHRLDFPLDFLLDLLDQSDFPLDLLDRPSVKPEQKVQLEEECFAICSPSSVLDKALLDTCSSPSSEYDNIGEDPFICSRDLPFLPQCENESNIFADLTYDENNNQREIFPSKETSSSVLQCENGMPGPSFEDPMYYYQDLFPLDFLYEDPLLEDVDFEEAIKWIS